MIRETIFELPSAYRSPLKIDSFHFGGKEKTVCVVGSMRGNEIQQLYICSQLIKELKRLEAEGRINNRYGITVIPAVNPSSINVQKRFWAMDNSDINRMFPGYDKGETTQRIAAGLFEKLQGYKYGIQPSSFYMPGEFVAHVRMMNTNYQDTDVAALFGLPFVAVREPVPYDTTTLNFNWQVWNTQAFSIYTHGTDSIDEKGAHMAVRAIMRFMARHNMIRFNEIGGHTSTVIWEKELVGISAPAAGIYRGIKHAFDEVRKGEVMAEIIDPLEGDVIEKVLAPEDGIVFFSYAQPLVMEHAPIFKLIGHLHR